MTTLPKGLSPKDREKIFRITTAYSYITETKRFFFLRLLDDITDNTSADEFAVKLECSGNYYYRLKEGDPSRHTKRMLVPIALVFGATLLQTLGFLTVAGQSFDERNDRDLAYLTLIARHCGEKKSEGVDIIKLNKELAEMGYADEIQFGSYDRDKEPLVHSATGKQYK